MKKLTDYMSSKNREIEEKGQTHQDYQLDLFNALQTVPNPDFAAFICDERQAWEIEGEKKPDQIIAEALTIYNDAVSADRWDNKDPKDAKILALTTQVETLVEAQKLYSAMVTSKDGANPNSNAGKSGGSRTNTGDFLSIKSWRMKKTEDSVKREGRTWYWCPHHKVEGSYDGLYVTHKPEEHDEWKCNRNQFRRKRYETRKKEESNESKDVEDNKKKLVINDNLKAALLTHSDLSSIQIDKILEDAASHSDF